MLATERMERARVERPQSYVAKDLEPRQLSGKFRAASALAGIIPGLLALPVMLSEWNPAWFVIAWTASYAALSALFIGLTLRRSTALVEQAWSISVASVFAAIPVSTVVADEATDVHFWMAATIGLIFIAFEMSTLPFLRINEWRIGPLLVGASVAITGFLTVHWVIPLATMVVVAAIIVSADRVRKLKLELESHLQLAQQAILHDPLTGLLNRRGLERAALNLSGQELTVALIDIDRFKLINDTYGHQVGDQALIKVAEELQRRFCAPYELARLGGDEFVAIGTGNGAVDASMTTPILVATELHNQQLRIDCSVSIGVSRGTGYDSGDRLLREAGFAMRESKRNGGGVSVFGADLERKLDRTIEVAAIGKGDRENGMFVPVGQTIVSDDDRIVGCELLIRWKRPSGELLEPAHFLPLLSDTGQMSAINDQMLEHAIEFASRFNNRPAAPFVSVNLESPHLSGKRFCERVEELLEQYRVPADRLLLEITETEQFGHFEQWEASAARLRSLGVLLAMDDFGTGYSSLERLRHLPISHLKFDRTLVQTVSGPFGEIVGGLARFASALTIGIIAEGIETLDERESMRAFNVQMFQGYLFHRPETLDQVEIKIIEDHVRHASLTDEPASPPSARGNEGQ